MITKTRFASSGVIFFSLLGPLLAPSVQASGLAMNQQTLPAILNIPPYVISTTEAASPAEMTLRNLDRTVDIALPIRPNYFHLNQPVFVEALEEIMDYEQRIRDAIDQGYVLSPAGEIIEIVSSDANDILLRIIEQSDLPLGLGEASALLVRSVGDAIGSASGLLHDAPDKPYPLTSALSDVTGGVADGVTAILQNNNQLQSLNDSPANSGLLAPVGNLVAGLTGGSSTLDSNLTGVLAPVTGLAEGLFRPLSNPPVYALETSPPIDNSSANSSANNGLLAPVTGLVSGLLGGPPR